MLPDFPSIKKLLTQFSIQILKHNIQNSSPIIESAGFHSIHEGDKHSMVHSNGDYELSEFKPITAEFTLTKSEITNLSSDELHQKFISLANQMSGQMTSNMFSLIDKVVEKTGNKISSPEGLTQDWILEALKKMPLDFVDDDINQPALLTIYASPETLEKFKIYQANLTNEEKEIYLTRYSEIIKGKYQEYQEDLESRKLYDK